MAILKGLIVPDVNLSFLTDETTSEVNYSKLENEEPEEDDDHNKNNNRNENRSGNCSENSSHDRNDKSRLIIN